MAEYSKAEKLQALEFLAQYLNSEGGNVRNRALYASVPEIGTYLDEALDEIPELMTIASSSVDEEGHINSAVKAELAETLNQIESRVEGPYRRQANYAPYNDSHHPIALGSQYVMGAELPMEDARRLYELANTENGGYPMGTQLSHMLSLPSDAHSQAHRSPKTGNVSAEQVGEDVFSAVNTNMRDVKLSDSTNFPSRKDDLIHTNLALALPYLEQEKRNSEAIYNSPAQVALRNYLAEEVSSVMDLPNNKIDDPLTRSGTARNARSVSAAVKAKLKRPTSTGQDRNALGLIQSEQDMKDLYDLILSDPAIEAEQTKLLNDLRRGISDKEIEDFNTLLTTKKGSDLIAEYIPQSVEEAMMPLDQTSTISLRDATDLINSMSDESVKQERIKREKQELIEIDGKGPNSAPVSRVEENYPKSLTDRSTGEMTRITHRLRPGAEQLLAPMIQNKPGLNRMIRAFKANRLGTI